MSNVYVQGEQVRVLDWGDSSISHPFVSLVVTFRFLEERNKLAVSDPWFRRLRDAYLEGWGPGLAGTFDFAFIDADKENYPAYLEWAVRLARPGTVIVADNVIRQGQILNPQTNAQAQAVRETLHAMGQDPRLDTAVIQTVGAKHWDGFAFALVR